jgi:hypothetical protein
MTPTSEPSPPGETENIEADITERLQRAAPFMRATGNAGIVGQHANTCEEAASVIDDLRRQKTGLEALLVDAQEEIAAAEMTIADLQVAREEMRAALRPFANEHRWASIAPRAAFARAAELVPEENT